MGHIIWPWTIPWEWIWAGNMQNMDQLLDHLEEHRCLIIIIYNIIKSMELFISSIIYEFN